MNAHEYYRRVDEVENVFSKVENNFLLNLIP